MCKHSVRGAYIRRTCHFSGGREMVPYTSAVGINTKEKRLVYTRKAFTDAHCQFASSQTVSLKEDGAHPRCRPQLVALERQVRPPCLLLLLLLLSFHRRRRRSRPQRPPERQGKEEGEEEDAGSTQRRKEVVEEGET